MAYKASLWTIGGLAVELGVSHRILGRKLKNLPPDGKTGTRNSDGWFLTRVIEHLQSGGDGAVLSLEVEKARQAKESADKLAIHNAQARRDLLPAEEVARADEAIIGAIREAFLALPDALAEQLCEKAAREGMEGVSQLLRDRIELVLSDAAGAELVGVARLDKVAARQEESDD